MRTQRSMRRRRRIGIVLFLLGLVPLIVSVAVVTASRLSGGGRSIPGDDLRTFRFYAEQVGFPETSPRSSVSVRITVSRKDSWGPRLAWMPWILRSDFELSGKLSRGDSGIETPLTDDEMSAMLRRHASQISTALIGMIWGPSSDVPPVITEMASAGEPRRRLTTIMWRNVCMDLAGWLGGWWKWSVWLAMAMIGAAIWRSNRAVPEGHCLHCRYDLRATPHSTVCPECGNAPNVASSNPSEP